jgi:hypothetical protein
MLRAILARLAMVSLLVPTFLALVPADPALANPGLTVQDQTTAGVTPTSLAQSLAGTGVTISNVTYAGTTRSSGQFQGGTTIIGFESGVILSSGFATDVIGPNDNDATSRVNGTGSDADLTALSGFPTFDRTVLEFDIVPQASTLTFQYVFASEEYNEYANTQFNDVFAFFVNGTNCATVPGTVPPQPVSINTINGGNPLGTNPKNPLLYRNNDLSDGGGLIDTQADGLTVVLTCNATVNANVTNHIKLAIADGSDPVLDSYVFLKAGSFISSNITLAPATDTNPTGTTHTVTATVTENGQPAQGKIVTFTVTAGPHLGTTGAATTDATGQASFTYTGVNAGTDTIKASYIGPSGQPQESNAVTKIWEFVGAATLTLSPKTDTNPVRTQHCVTATALNTAGGPAMNVLVRFAVSGSVTATGSDTTDANGEAEFCYSGPTFPGDDDISAYADNNENGTQQADEPGDTAKKAWVIPASTADCKVTFGGRITATNGDKATFGGNAKATPSGNIQYSDQGPADAATVHSTDVLAVTCAADGVSATIYGEAMDSGTGPWMFRIDLTDMAEPGRNDTFRIQLTNGYDSGEQTLEKGGNIQLH